MVGSSKILTVSYGTFSCTLEGFDDSFSTMKAIAEYFRDLAADDRYFGAEPASPDAEMLARIAEREIERRVVARTSASGIVLRAAGALSAPVAAVETRHAAPSVDDNDDEADEPPPAAETMMPPRPQPAAPPAPDSDGDSVAAKLQRIRAVVGRAPTASPSLIESGEEDQTLAFSPVAEAAPTGAAVEATAGAIEEEPAKEAAPRAEDVSQEAAAPDEALDQATAAEVAPEDDSPAVTEERSRLDPAAPALVAEADPEATGFLVPTNDNDSPEEVADSQNPAAGAASSTASVDDVARFDLRSIEPQVSEEVADTDELTDDSADAEDAAELLADAAFAAAEVAAVAPWDAESEGADVDSKAEASTEDPNAGPGLNAEADENRAAELVAGLMAGAGADEPEAAAVPVANESGIQAPQVESEAEIDAVEVVPVAGEADADVQDTIAVEVDAPTVDGTAAEGGDAVEAAVDIADQLEPAPEPAAAADDDLPGADPRAERVPVRTRIVRMSRSEYEARFAVPEPDSPLLADLGAEEDDAAAAEAEPATALSSEEEAALMAELAALEAEPDAEAEAEDPAQFWDQAVMAGELDWSEPAAEPGAAAMAEPQEEAVLAEEAHEDMPLRRPGHAFVEPEADEASLARLLSRAEGELAAPEAQTRREAITGLKAAVAAAEAARQLGEGPGIGDEEAFRDDLRQVVRPRRPEPADARSERPRPAPLKLVAAQRVDLPPEAAGPRPGEPVRPRRVTAEDAAEEVRSTDGAFASFAREMGARDLPDLLEAAAAYTAFVEGIEDFSRPQLVNRVREMAPESFSREDELRSFGTLLRQGRIAKVRNGRFQVTEATRFNPERRAG